MGKIIEFYVAANWDARVRRVFTRPPANWDEMSNTEQEAFLEREAHQWAEEEMEIGGVVYDDPSEIDNSRWGDSYDDDMLEDMFIDVGHSALSDPENVQLELIDE